jgi:glycosyltransferase involved in cell wall biosynthesis
MEEGDYEGLPALKLRPRTNLAFDLRNTAIRNDGVAEGRCLAQGIADFAREHKVDLIHILQWGHLKGVLFEAAIRAGIPFVHTPYEYWSVCPMYYLRQHNRTLCSGPDDYGRKCWDCINHFETVPAAYADPKLQPPKTWTGRFKRRLQIQISTERIMRLFGPRWAPFFGSVYASQWELALRLRSVRAYLAHAARILPMTPLWADELRQHLRLPKERFTVCPPGIPDSATPLPKGNRFAPPLQFGHLHRVSRETGTYFVLEAWRKACIKPAQAVLNIYGQTGAVDFLRESEYRSLIDAGCVRVHEGRIANRLDEVLSQLAAVITCYMWKTGGDTYPDAIAHGVPSIVARGDDDLVESNLIFDGINGFTFRRGDANALADVLQKCALDPERLARLYDTCSLPVGWRLNDMIERYLRVYEDVLHLH